VRSHSRQITSGVITLLARQAHASVDDVPPVAPPLPRGLADPRPVVGIGTLAWFTAAVVLLIARGPSVWLGACVIGGLLGLLGFAMIHAQRSAARRGSRSAQRGVL
jgi:hypothetical protein